MNYQGTIIKESLTDKSVLKKVKILSTKVEAVVEKHQTPWLSLWTLHKIEILEKHAETVAKELSLSLEKAHPWYADFKNTATHYIIFRNKIFKTDRQNKEQYEKAKKYGITLGIPEHQVDFSSEIK